MGFSKRLRKLIYDNYNDIRSFVSDFNEKKIDGVTVSPATISNILGKDRKCQYPLVVAFAKFFHVSTDYLLGLSDSKTSDIDIKQAAEFLGLFPDIAEMLRNFKNHFSDSEYYLYALNFIIFEMCSASRVSHSDDLAQVATRSDVPMKTVSKTIVGKISDALNIVFSDNLKYENFHSYILDCDGNVKIDSGSDKGRTIFRFSSYDLALRLLDSLKDNCIVPDITASNYKLNGTVQQFYKEYPDDYPLYIDPDGVYFNDDSSHNEENQ